MLFNTKDRDEFIDNGHFKIDIKISDFCHTQSKLSQKTKKKVAMLPIYPSFTWEDHS